ncbi:sensor histidine kinase [Acidicapsa dinghuensis]|uniref:histidine kinase n=1 Tax=Acidicapsa dinghuensis TaxID=2218256 RepID=A0ABW1EPF7_9BACT|nr:ATP-binding protein [Acidicapsa dinghuensis]
MRFAGREIRFRRSSVSLRMRLTLWYGGAFAALLVVFIGVATFVHYQQLVKQVYHSATQELETAEGLLVPAPDGLVTLNEDYFNNPQMRLRLERLLEVLTVDGRVLYRNKKLHDEDLGGPPLPNEGRGTYNERIVRLEDGRRVLVVSHYHRFHGQPLILRLAYDEAPIISSITQFVEVLALLAPLAVILAMWVVFTVTGRALSPLSRMVRRAEWITAERLSERLPVHNPKDDLGHAARVFNELLQRLEDSFRQLKRFTSDASHELRTPLASLRSIGEVSLQTQHSPEEYREVIASMLEEVRRLTQLVDSLLAISRADSGQIQLKTISFPLLDLVHEVEALVGILAEDKHQTIRIAGNEDIVVHADRGILRQAVLNVVDNAIKYSPEGSEITIALEAESQGSPERAVISVTDQGPGIPETEQTHIFDRFYRIDSGRSRDHGGAGLGLAIAKWAVEVNDGTIAVFSEGAGSCFSIRLPIDRQIASVAEQAQLAAS